MASIRTVATKKGLEKKYDKILEDAVKHEILKSGSLNELREIVVDNLEALIAFTAVQKKEAESERSLSEKIKFIEENSSTSIHEIYVSAITKRVEYLYNDLKDVIEKGGSESSNKDNSRKFGSANAKLEKYVNGMVEYNDSVNENERVYISTGSISKNTEWMKKNYNIDEDKFIACTNEKDGIRVNARTLKNFFQKNRDWIIEMNVRASDRLFEDSIRYLREDDRIAMKKIAKKYGYKG